MGTSERGRPGFDGVQSPKGPVVSVMMEMTRHQLSQSAREDYVYSGDTASTR